jgi:hypothetical protein
MARAGINAAVAADTPAIIFNAASDDGGAVSISITCLSTASNPALVSVTPNFKSSEAYTLAVGETMIVRSGNSTQGTIEAVAVLGSGGITGVKWYVAANNF